jgi:hypothetical protein
MNTQTLLVVALGFVAVASVLVVPVSAHVNEVIH